MVVCIFHIFKFHSYDNQSLAEFRGSETKTAPKDLYLGLKCLHLLCGLRVSLCLFF